MVEHHLKRSADCPSAPHPARNSLGDSPTDTRARNDLQRITSSPIHKYGHLKIWDARRILQEFPAHIPCCDTARLNPTIVQHQIRLAGYKNPEIHLPVKRIVSAGTRLP